MVCLCVCNFLLSYQKDLMVTIGSLDLLRRKLSGLNRNLLELQFFFIISDRIKDSPFELLSCISWLVVHVNYNYTLKWLVHKNLNLKKITSMACLPCFEGYCCYLYSLDSQLHLTTFLGSHEMVRWLVLWCGVLVCSLVSHSIGTYVEHSVSITNPYTLIQ